MLIDPRPVAVARMGLGLATVLNAFEMQQLLGRIASGAVALPVFDWTPAPTLVSVRGYLIVAGMAGLALLFGWHSTAASIVTTILNIVIFLWDEQTYSSHRLLAMLLVAYLAFARSDAVWAVRPIGGPVRREPQVLMMTQLSVVYLFASLSKLNVLFLSGAPLSVWLWIPLPRWGFTAMAIGTVATEFFLAGALWIGRYRAVAMVVGTILHLSIVILMADQTLPLIAFSITCLCLYPLFWFSLGTPTHRDSANQGGEGQTVTDDAQPAQRHTESA